MILDLDKKTSMFLPEQIEAINLYVLLHSGNKDNPLHEFNVQLDGLRVAEFLHHDFVQPEDLDIELITKNLKTLIDEYVLQRQKEENSEMLYEFKVADHLIYLSLLEFYDYIQGVLEPSDFDLILELFKIIEPKAI